MAFADIIYPEKGVKKGRLLYVKPSYQGGEPASVRSYASSNPAFPHEPTSDQLFGESQFEAYRALGEYILSELDRPDATYGKVDDFIEAAASELRRSEPSKGKHVSHLKGPWSSSLLLTGGRRSGIGHRHVR